MSDVRLLVLLAGAAVLLIAAPTIPPMDFETTRWLLAAWWFAGGVLLMRVGDPLLTLGLAGMWLSPVLLMTRRPPGDAAVSGMFPLLAVVVGVLLLLAMRDLILAGQTVTLRAALLAACAANLARRVYDWFGIRRELRPGRLVGPFFRFLPRYKGAVGFTGNPLHFGAMMALGLPLLLSTQYAWWAPAVALVLGFGVLFSRSRIAILAVVVAALLVLPWWTAPITGGVGLAGLFLRGGSSSGVWPHLAGQIVRDPRWSIWRATCSMIADRPWLGVGLGAFHEAIGRNVNTPDHPQGWTNAHNEALTLAAECGVPTAAALTAWWGWHLWGAASVETAVGLGILGALAAFGFPIRFPATAPFALYYGARALTGV